MIAAARGSGKGPYPPPGASGLSSDPAAQCSRTSTRWPRAANAAAHRTTCLWLSAERSPTSLARACADPAVVSGRRLTATTAPVRESMARKT